MFDLYFWLLMLMMLVLNPISAGAIGAFLGFHRGDALLGFLLGFCLSFVGWILILVLMKPKSCGSCHTYHAVSKCPVCGTPLELPAADPA